MTRIAAVAALALVLCTASVAGQVRSEFTSAELLNKITTMESRTVFIDSGYTDPEKDICLKAGTSRIVTKSDTTICVPKQTFATKVYVEINTMDTETFESMLDLNKNAVSHGLFLDIGRGSVPLVDLTIRMERIKTPTDSTTERIHWLDKRLNAWFPICADHSFDKVKNTVTATIPREVIGGINFSLDDLATCATAASPACSRPAGVLAIFETNSADCSESVPNKIASTKEFEDEQVKAVAGTGVGKEWSNGEIAGLVVGILVGLGIIACILYYFCCVAPTPEPLPRKLPDNTQYPVPWAHQTHVYTKPADSVVVQTNPVPVPAPLVQTTQIVPPQYAPPPTATQTIRLTKHVPLQGPASISYR